MARLKNSYIHPYFHRSVRRSSHQKKEYDMHLLLIETVVVKGATPLHHDFKEDNMRDNDRQPSCRTQKED